ncbi:uncharacterized protein PHALS_00388 [Plasmopara halstedii]|uniref:Uncharacterized protein n=1 Tax=Plasmopara halstedii TaxID=4781 RepID=A0A0P1A657_PLAHL|nr:uncharacterized protein PHALS_00388 [Plasmopara halstedii]CEG36068.1 hypothetical protein PHALS_00388 [Plasmopara halstedii]|eukprot:XP_024572437.1 hypothetical protein PHALS_00388 [Plasmopara halstedii]
MSGKLSVIVLALFYHILYLTFYWLLRRLSFVFIRTSTTKENVLNFDRITKAFNYRRS